MSRIAYVNGRYVPHRLASVHVEDRGYQFADGIYEVVYLHRGRLIDSGLHLSRLERSLREVRIALPVGMDALLAILGEVQARNRVSTGLIYIQVTRGVARREHVFPRPGTRPSLVVTVRRTPTLPKNLDAWQGEAITVPDQRWARCDIKSVGLLPNVLAKQAAREQGATEAITVPDQRWARCDIKSVGLLPNVLAKQAAREQGATEAIMVDADGMVTEGSSTTVWIVDAGGVLRTRALSERVLPGCTRAALAEELAACGIGFEERPFSAAELRGASEVFLTSATSFVKPMVRLDGETVGDGTPGPVARRMFDLLSRRIGGGVNSAFRM